MAAFTSTGAGNWNDGGTWGNTSPGVKGTDWPGIAGDTATIAHDVSYNVSETNEMGAITINSSGILNFLTTANTKLTMGHEDITVNSGGELRVGTSGTPIGSAYTAELIWATTSGNVKGISRPTGGIVKIYGDPAYYGSDDKTTLANNAENTDGDKDIITNDDMSGKWNVGDTVTLLVKNDPGSAPDTNAVILDTIATISTTTITLTTNNITCDTGVGDTWTSPVVNVTRNVKLSKSGVSPSIGTYISGPRIYSADGGASDVCEISNASITGFYAALYSVDYAVLTDVVISNGSYFTRDSDNLTITRGQFFSSDYGIRTCQQVTCSADLYACRYGTVYSARNGTFSGDIYGSRYGFEYTSDMTYTGNVFSSRYFFMHSSNSTITGDVHGCENACYFSYGLIFTGNIYNCSSAIDMSSDILLTGKLGWTSADVQDDNTYDVDRSTNVVLRAVKLPSGGLTLYAAGGEFGDVGVKSEDHNQTLGASYYYQTHGNLTKNTTTVRAGGASDSIEVIPLSTLSGSYNYVKMFEWIEFDVAASAQSRSVYMKVDAAWSPYPTNTQLYIEAEYLNHATLLTKATAVSTEVISGTGWTEFTLSFTPSQAGLVRYRGYLKLYEASRKIYVDNQLS